MRVHQTSDLHRQIEKLPKVERFLFSLKRNSLSTSNGYKTSIAYFHKFLLNNYNQTADSILQVLINKEVDVKYTDRTTNLFLTQTLSLEERNALHGRW
jgi:hypothetical protein